ncbi:uncharacterized protein LOC134947588 isoform X3 [Pseudophryne corroboree]|uniref:uncharacterized protein LOC134947588 isoform X3 n=1 Tax=Pseudophryne corroboree TaxID=495146 RepID=UPI00308183D4
MDSKVSLGEDLVLTLSEFDDALQDFTRGPCVISSQRSSLNTSEENFSFSFTNTRHHPKAKLGDTKELENFITDLDKVLSDF